MTLLFAFFVVMFASTQNDKYKAKDVSDSVRQALEHGQLSAAISTVLGRGKHEARKAPWSKETTNERENPNAPPPSPPETHPPDLAKSLDTLQRGLDSDLKNGKLQLRLDARGLIISMREKAFFASGDDAIAPGSLPILAKIAAVVQSLPNSVRLDGHTGARPIHHSRFQSNWELSAARSIAMLELLRDRLQIPPSRMAVAGYAENSPVDTNETEEGRAHNRRVDLVLLSAGGLTGAALCRYPSEVRAGCVMWPPGLCGVQPASPVESVSLRIWTPHNCAAKESAGTPLTPDPPASAVSVWMDRQPHTWRGLWLSFPDRFPRRCWLCPARRARARRERC